VIVDIIERNFKRGYYLGFFHGALAGAFIVGSSVMATLVYHYFYTGT